MTVEAIKVQNGFLIPFNEPLRKIAHDRILLEIAILEQKQIEEGYAILDELAGFCASGRTDASIKHDDIVYGKRA